MSSPNQTMAAKNKKQPKPRRSLKKRTSPHPVEPDHTLAIDMSKSELDNIFLGLHLGQLDNPQMALAKVYMLALDSIENALLQGITDICNSFASNEIIPVEGNPLAPWLNQLLNTDPEKLKDFQDNLKTKFDQAKQNLQKTVSDVLSQDTNGENVIGSGSSQSRQAWLELLKDPAAKLNLPIAQKQLTQDRLSEIYKQIQSPIPEDGKKRYHFTKTPGTYRFSFGSGDAPKTSKNSPLTPEAVQKQEELTSPKECSVLEPANVTLNHTADANIPDIVQVQPAPPQVAVDLTTKTLPSDHTENAHISEANPIPVIASPQPSQFPIELPQISTDSLVEVEAFQAIAETSLDLAQVARDMTDAMTELAIQIGNETIKAFAEDHILPRLSDSLKDDPRLSQDNELCAFIDTLEVDSPLAEDVSGDDIDNEELANAFATLLNEFE